MVKPLLPLDDVVFLEKGLTNFTARAKETLYDAEESKRLEESILAALKRENLDANVDSATLRSVISNATLPLATKKESQLKRLSRNLQAGREAAVARSLVIINDHIKSLGHKRKPPKPLPKIEEVKFQSKEKTPTQVWKETKQVEKKLAKHPQYKNMETQPPPDVHSVHRHMTKPAPDLDESEVPLEHAVETTAAPAPPPAPTSTSNIAELQRFYEEQLLKRIAKERARVMTYDSKPVRSAPVPVDSASSEESSDSEADLADSDSEDSVDEQPVVRRRKRRSQKYYTPRYMSRAFNGANYAYGEPRVYKPRSHRPYKKRRSDDKYEPVEERQQPRQEVVKEPQEKKAEPVQTHENVERTRARSPIPTPTAKPPVSNFDLFRQHFLGNSQV